MRAKSPPVTKMSYTEEPDPGNQRDPLSAGFASCTQRGHPKGMP